MFECYKKVKSKSSIQILLPFFAHFIFWVLMAHKHIMPSHEFKIRKKGVKNGRGSQTQKKKKSFITTYVRILLVPDELVYPHYLAKLHF